MASHRPILAPLSASTNSVGEARSLWPTLRVAFATCVLLTVSADAMRVRAEAIAEGFDHNRSEGIALFDQSGERVFRSMSSRFAWGAYSASGTPIKVATGNTVTWLAFQAGAFVPGSYVYTRFDATTVQASGGMANKPSRRIDLSGNGARFIVSLLHCPRAVEVSLLLRDAAGWWRSSPHPLGTHAPNYNEERRIEIDPKALTWVKVVDARDLDEVDDGGASPLQDGPAGTPAWRSIEGMGLIAASDASRAVVEIGGLSLTDGVRPRIDPKEPLRRSDIAFLHKPLPLEKFDEYGGAKIVYWDQGWQPDQVALTRDYGVREMPVVSGGVIGNNLAQADPALKAAIGRDLWGHEVLVGNESFPNGMQARMCIRQPAFHQYVRDYVRRNIYDCGARELLVDEPAGFNGGRESFHYDGACFCERCNEGFREWLGRHAAEIDLKAHGITNLDSFDYRAFLLGVVGVNADRTAYRKAFEAGKLPLINHFIRFQQEPQREFFLMIKAYARSLDPNFVVSANTFNLRPEVLFLAEEVDADFHGAETAVYLYDFKQFGKAIQRLRLADDLGLRVVTSSVFWEYRHARQHGLVEIFKPVIAAFYASGHHFAVPDYYRWTDPNYYGPIPEFAPFYRFIRQHADLFDGYETITQVGVIMDNSAMHEYTGDPAFVREYEHIGQALVSRSIPFGVTIAADGFHYRKEMTRRDLEERFQIVVIPRHTRFQGSQARVIEELTQGGRVHTWDDRGIGPVQNRLQPWVRSNREKAFVAPRRRAAGDPLVVHVVNLDYTPDKVAEQRGVVIDLHREMLGGAVAAIEGFSPDDPSGALPVSFTQKAEGVTIDLPQLRHWTVLKVSVQPASTP